MRSLTEVVTDGVLTHKMCCVCFAMTPLCDLWTDAEGERWDLCSQDCADKSLGPENEPVSDFDVREA